MGEFWASITESFSFYCLAIDGWWKLGPYAVVQVPLDRATVTINVNIYSIPRFLGIYLQWRNIDTSKN